MGHRRLAASLHRGMSAFRSRRPLQLVLGVLAVAMIAVATLALAGAGSAFGEVTGAADNLRTGWYPDEPSLTPAKLSKAAAFSRSSRASLKGQIYAQPLTANGTLLVATEENWVYGLDPNSGSVRWEKQFGTPVAFNRKRSRMHGYRRAHRDHGHARDRHRTQHRLLRRIPVPRRQTRPDRLVHARRRTGKRQRGRRLPGQNRRRSAESPRRRYSKPPGSCSARRS